MINLHELRYVRLGTRDIGAAAKYAADILGLQLVRREGGWAYLRSDERDHTLVYFEGIRMTRRLHSMSSRTRRSNKRARC